MLVDMAKHDGIDRETTPDSTLRVGVEVWRMGQMSDEFDLAEKTDIYFEKTTRMIVSAFDSAGDQVVVGGIAHEGVLPRVEVVACLSGRPY